MQILSAPLQQNSALALGMFDGVHLGHRAIIQEAVNYAKANNLSSAVLTFVEHPKSLTAKSAPGLINSLESRLSLFADLGLDYALVLNFTESLMNMSPEEYIRVYVQEYLRAQFVSLGFNHHFGKNRSGSAEYLQSWCTSQNIQVSILPEFQIDGLSVSSSRIRTFIQDGDIQEANKLLGYDFFVESVVVRGSQLGSRIGFPTLNLQIPHGLISPKPGVYAGYVSLDSQVVKAAINIGYRPSFNYSDELCVEAHLLDYSDDLYGRKIRLHIVHRLRDELRFGSEDELKSQIASDIQLIRSLN